MPVEAYRKLLRDWGIRYLRVTKCQNKSYGFVRVFKLSDLENVQQQIKGIACPQNGEANAPISYLKAALAKWELNLLPGKPKNSTPKPPQPDVTLPTQPQQPLQIPSSTTEIATVPHSQQPLTQQPQSNAQPEQLLPQPPLFDFQSQQPLTQQPLSNAQSDQPPTQQPPPATVAQQPLQHQPMQPAFDSISLTTIPTNPSPATPQAAAKRPAPDQSPTEDQVRQSKRHDSHPSPTPTPSTPLDTPNEEINV